jgi:hypothetical protein
MFHNYWIQVFGWWIVVELLRLFIASLILFAILLPSTAYGQLTEESPFFSGERLTYRVKWMFIRLGTVEITQQALDTSENRTYAITMHVQSAQGLPFINLDFTHQTHLASSPLHVFDEIITSSTGEKAITVYRHGGGYLSMSDSATGKPGRFEIIPIDTSCYDANSLLMFARLFVASGRNVQLPTVNDFAIGQTELNFHGRLEDIEVPAFDHSISCRAFQGDAKWVGTSFAGMSGEFRGWISNDRARVPLRAELKIALGSITLELESYLRPGWCPSNDSNIVKGN